MLDKDTAMKAYGEGKCVRLFSYTGQLAQQGYLPGEWLQKHLKAAGDPNNTFLVYDDNSIGLYEIIR